MVVCSFDGLLKFLANVVRRVLSNFFQYIAVLSVSDVDILTVFRNGVKYPRPPFSWWDTSSPIQMVAGLNVSECRDISSLRLFLAPFWLGNSVQSKRLSKPVRAVGDESLHYSRFPAGGSYRDVRVWDAMYFVRGYCKKSYLGICKKNRVLAETAIPLRSLPRPIDSDNMVS